MKLKNKPIQWSAELAYITGIITADGSLSKNGRSINITSNDVELLKTIKECLEIDNKISNKKSGYTGKPTSYYIQIGNVRLYRWLLNKVGLHSNKAYSLSSLNVPDKYFFHFARGCMDGDGYIRRYMDPAYPNSERIYLRFTAKNLDHLQWLEYRMGTLANTKGHIRKVIRAHELSYAKLDSLHLLQKMYPTHKVPCLRRKYKLIQDII